jgi:hypothetical protein
MPTRKARARWEGGQKAGQGATTRRSPRGGSCSLTSHKFCSTVSLELQRPPRDKTRPSIAVRVPVNMSVHLLAF